MVDDKRVRELMEEMRKISRKRINPEFEYERFLEQLLEVFGNDVGDIIKYYNEIDIHELSYISGSFYYVYRKFTTDDVWDEIVKLRKKVDKYEQVELKKIEKRLFNDTKKLIKNVDKVCKSEKDFEKPVYQELLQKIEIKFNDIDMHYNYIADILGEFSVDVLKKLKPLLEKLKAEGWGCMRYSLERIEEDAK